MLGQNFILNLLLSCFWNKKIQTLRVGIQLEIVSMVSSSCVVIYYSITYDYVN